LIAKDSDFQWLRDKREAEAEAEFQQWFATNFDHASVEQKQMARELWPDFYRQRLAKLDEDILLLRRLAHLKVTGIKNKDDMLLQYAAEAGFIDADPLEKILHPERAAKSQQQARRQLNFVRGLFNPNRLPRGDWGLFNRQENATELLGRQPGVPFGTTPAYLLGTGNSGFSAIGPQTPISEKNQNFQEQMTAMGF
jgi:hypothetical protein